MGRPDLRRHALWWRPPQRFDVARTELVYVPDARRGDLVRHLSPASWRRAGARSCAATAARGAASWPIPFATAPAGSGYEPELELEVKAPEGGGAIVELAVLRVG